MSKSYSPTSRPVPDDPNPGHDPPAYSSPVITTGTEPPPPCTVPGLGHIDMRQYRPRDSQISLNRTTVNVYSKELCTNAAALEEFIQTQIRLPPRPIVRVENPEELGGMDFMINCTGCICPTDGRSRNWSYVKITGREEEGGGRESHSKDNASVPDENVSGVAFWVKRFCADQTPIKSFTLRRTVVNWSTDYLAALIRQTISGAGHQGSVRITFPIEVTRVVVHSQPQGFLSDIRSLFSWSKKNVDVVNVVWPAANMPRSGGSQRVNGPRNCVSQDEDEWCRDWKDAIVVAVQQQRRGWVTADDKIDALLSLDSL